MTSEGRRDILGLWAGGAPSVTGGPVGKAPSTWAAGRAAAELDRARVVQLGGGCLLGVRAGRGGRYLVFARTPRQLR